MTSSETPGFFSRLGLAFSLFFKVLFDAVFAGRARRLEQPEPPPEPARAPAKPEPRVTEPARPIRVEPKAPAVAPETAALQLLAALQREGRFVDFVREDIGTVKDEELGAHARAIHAGARRVLDGWFTFEAIWPGEDGSPVVVQAGFDARRVRLIGNVTGEAPFKGTLTHQGWRVSKSKLPSLSDAADPSVIAPAEVEL
jgi:hypothetical protein